MAYCTLVDMRRILPSNISIGDQNIGTPVPGRTGNQGSGRSNMSELNAKTYIQYAQQYIDARLRPFYLCPLRKIKSYEDEILSDINQGQDIEVTVRDSGAFSIGNVVRLQDKTKMETTSIKDVSSSTTIVIENSTSSYASADGTKISIIEYPDPIQITATRLACSYLLDTLFVAEQSPDVSTYGKTQRNLARNAIDDILAGEVLLLGQERTGRRFVRGTLLDRYDSPSEVQRGEERE